MAVVIIIEVKTLTGLQRAEVGNPLLTANCDYPVENVTKRRVVLYN